MKTSTIDDLKSEAANYRKMAERIEELIAFAQGQSPVVTIVPANEQSAPPNGNIRFRRTIKLTLSDATEQVFKNLRRPLSKKDLIEEVARIGCTVTNPDSFASILSRDKRFRPIGDGTWFLSSALADDRQGKLKEIEK